MTDCILEAINSSIQAYISALTGGLPIPGEAARYSGMMPPTHSEMMSPTVPR